MNRDNFLESLEKSLNNIPPEEREDIIYDYEEHFRMGMEQGKSEEEIARSLGNPKNIARHYTAGYIVKQAEESKSTRNITKAILAIIGLSFFNIVVVLGPFLGLLGVLLGFFSTAVAITLSGLAVLFAFIAYPFFPAAFTAITISGPANIAAGIFLSIGIIALGFLLLIAVYYLARFFYTATIAYLKLNLKVINNKED